MFYYIGVILFDLKKLSKFAWGRLLNRAFGFYFFSGVVLLLAIFVKAENSYSNINEQLSADDDTHHTPTSIFYSEENYDISTDFYYEETGYSSWYGNRFHQRKTASGERYDMYAYSAAHRTLPFGTIVRVTNLDNNGSVLVRINDRGPFIRKRIIDLSLTAMKDIESNGNNMVKIEALICDTDAYTNNPYSQKFFMGYSFDKPLVCLPQSTLQFIDSTSNFTEAVIKYKEILQEYKSSLYLMTALNSNANEPTEDGTYYIALYSPYDSNIFTLEEIQEQR